MRVIDTETYFYLKLTSKMIKIKLKTTKNFVRTGLAIGLLPSKMVAVEDSSNAWNTKPGGI